MSLSSHIAVNAPVACSPILARLQTTDVAWPAARSAALWEWAFCLLLFAEPIPIPYSSFNQARTESVDREQRLLVKEKESAQVEEMIERAGIECRVSEN